MQTFEGRDLLPLDEHVHDELRLYGKKILSEVKTAG